MKDLKVVVLFAIVILFSGYNVYNSQNTKRMSDITLENIEALAQSEGGHYYEVKKIETVRIWDDSTGTYEEMVVIRCSGTGDLDCTNV